MKRINQWSEGRAWLARIYFFSNKTVVWLHIHHKASTVKLIKAYLITFNKTYEILYFGIYVRGKNVQKSALMCEAACANQQEFAVKEWSNVIRAESWWSMGAATRGESVTCPDLACVHKNLINPIMCCRCRHISRELTILRAQYVENAFDQGFMKEAVALMILLTFPGDCKDSSGNNQISMSFLSFGWEAFGGSSKGWRWGAIASLCFEYCRCCF